MPFIRKQWIRAALLTSAVGAVFVAFQPVTAQDAVHAGGRG